MNRNHLVFLLHVLFWTQNFFRNIAFSWHYQIEEIICDQLLIASLCYVNYFFLFPYILKKNKLSYYLLWIFVFIGGFTCIYTGWTLALPYLFEVPEIKETVKIVTVSFNISFLYGAMSSGSRLALNWAHNQDKNKELLLQKTNSQIQWMKSNINIPFILETLSYTEKSTKENPKAAEEPILLLSNILRYGLYESESSTINLEREIEIIKEFIALQNTIDSSIALTLQVNITERNVLVIPNIMVRFIGLWKLAVQNNIKGAQTIFINGNTNTVVLKLPIDQTIDFNSAEIKTKIPVFNNELFAIDYKQEGDYLCLEIINLNL